KSRDKSDQATHEKVLDVRTKMILYKMFHKVFTKFDGCVSTGKEANVYHAISAKHEGGSLAIKIFKTVASEFRNRTQYMEGEFRFQNNTCTSNIRKLVPKWTEKEFRNLQRIYKAGIKCPEPILYLFYFDSIRPANRLKDEELTHDEYEKMYRDCVLLMRKMFQVCKLVHADLSEFNLLYVFFQNSLYVIDVSQSVEMDNENALKFLNMDVKNVTNYFRKQGVVTMSCRKLRNFVVGTEITDEDRYIDEAIQEACDRHDEDDDDLVSACVFIYWRCTVVLNYSLFLQMADQTEIPYQDADMCVKDLRRHAGQVVGFLIFISFIRSQ
ncbi:hypothetical protein HELRODRAFT_75979, partial [Helobdella robusta]|uniref:non-specific serine/threonine protein kinase n=1 Tax=Helobdella robusta TaxID=6412 RepID=T1G2D4_HELRO